MFLNNTLYFADIHQFIRIILQIANTDTFAIFLLVTSQWFSLTDINIGKNKILKAKVHLGID